MVRRLRLLTFIFGSLLLLLGQPVNSQPRGKKKVSNQSDLPRFIYPVSQPASELVQADAATFNAFASKVEADLDTIFRDFEIEDKAAVRRLLSARLDIQELTGQNQSALETLASLRAAQEKPADRLATGVFETSVLHAAIETKSTGGPVFDASFKSYYQQAVDSLPWDVVQDSIRSLLAQQKISTKAVILGFVKTEIDPAVRKSGVLDNEQAWNLIGIRNALQFNVPLKDTCTDVLSRYIAAHNVLKPDIWQARDVSLSPEQKLTPVLVGIWDSGVDVSLFESQLFTDPHPTLSGNHGLAYDDNGFPSTAWLHPLTQTQQQRYPGFREELKGFLDLGNGIDSAEARGIQQEVNTLNSDQLHELFELNKVISHYIHGTHVAGIVARGNPAVRLVVARFNDQLPDLPFPPTPDWARHMAADFQQISEYFRTRNVRVVNMSWVDDPQEFETWLSKAGIGAEPGERKRRAAELFGIWRDAVENAIKNAPNTLFVCAAGNSNSNAGFLQDVPASLRLPNLITVGAVNQAGDETSFTSYGDTVVVHANGYEIESYLPGGSKLKLSGTSMASPNVANLAAKLFAIDSSLTPAEVIELIKKSATATDDGRRHLIDPKRSVALLQATMRTQ